MESEIIITRYISAWGWNIIAILFLCSSFIMVAMSRTIATSVFATSFFVLFAVCEYIALKRKKEVYEVGSIK